MNKPYERCGVQHDAVQSTEASRSPYRSATEPPIAAIDRPMELAHAATALGVPYHVVQRAARRGLVPTYRLGTSRPYVKLRDFFDLMERSSHR
jgi:hypothetical protein